MSSKHTPGKWEVKNRTSIVAGNSQVATAGFKMGDWPQTDFDEEAANARLIAAAPDLLAACKAALNSITCAQPMRAARCKHGHGIDECDDCLVENLRSAIARAEGGGE